MYEKIREQTTDEKQERRALLVSVYKGSGALETCEEHLEELELLCETYGLEVLEKVPCQVRKYTASTFITSGKVDELFQTSKDIKADVVVFDDEITPGQQRNLEKLFNLPVIDRTEVILGVFAQRAHTKESKLQVELAQLKYQSPRLKRMWTHLSRQQAMAGGGAYLKGKGEKQIEIDRRLLKKRMGLLQKDIEELKAHRHTQRGMREKSEIPLFAIIGYTNAGKSTLLNALTDAGIFVEDKLFATLD
ncbi:MAG: GTPase HflX, partial [Waddliaceae bacterium]